MTTLNADDNGDADDDGDWVDGGNNDGDEGDYGHY